MTNAMMTPREIVSELDKYIVGQNDAKRAVAVALRNRWRRSRVAEPLHSEITPKNILMIGPTGVGKTEIARRLAKLTDAPFVKTEATKFTEVGYVGRNVESIIKDLMEAGMKLMRETQKKKVQVQAREAAVERVLDLLVPPATAVTDENGAPVKPAERPAGVSASRSETVNWTTRPWKPRCLPRVPSLTCLHPTEWTTWKISCRAFLKRCSSKTVKSAA